VTPVSSTAVHEAGHAVAADMLGRSIDLVTIRESTDRFGEETSGHMRFADSDKVIRAFDTGVDTDYWLDSTAVVALAGSRAQQHEFGDCHWSRRQGDFQVLMTILDEAVDRTEERVVIDGWDEQTRALFRRPAFLPAVRTVARRLEERKTLTGLEVAELVEAVEAYGSQELPSWFLARSA
jgi:hypothetical protein